MRWGTPERPLNRLQYAIDIVEHIAVPEPENAVPVPEQFRCAGSVGFVPLAMLAAIELDHQLVRGTREIGDAAADRMLPPELPFRQPFSQGSPDNQLDVRGIAAKPSRSQRSSPQRQRQGPHLTLTLSAPGGGEGISEGMSHSHRAYPSAWRRYSDVVRRRRASSRARLRRSLLAMRG